jgi:hypothetical protein
MYVRKKRLLFGMKDMLLGFLLGSCGVSSMDGKIPHLIGVYKYHPVQHIGLVCCKVFTSFDCVQPATASAKRRPEKTTRSGGNGMAIVTLEDEIANLSFSDLVDAEILKNQC